MATNFWRKIGEIGDMLAFRNRLQNRNYDFKKLNDMDFSALCRNLVKFSPVTSKFTMLKMTTCAEMRQKLAYHATINIWEFTDLVGICMGIVNLTFVWQSPVKEFWKSVSNLPSYRQKSSVLFFCSQCIDGIDFYRHLSGYFCSL